MINFKELEKIVTTGKVATIVVIIDGIEQFAMTFPLETVGYKKILEAAGAMTAKIADKPKPADKPMPSNKEYVAQKKEEIAADIPFGEPVKTVPAAKSKVTTKAPVAVPKAKVDWNEPMPTPQDKLANKAPAIKSPGEFVEGNKPMTRAQILEDAKKTARDNYVPSPPTTDADIEEEEKDDQPVDYEEPDQEVLDTDDEW